MTACLALAALCAYAQAPVAEETSVRESMTVTEILQTGGWLMYVLGAMSVAGLTFVFYFLLVLRQEKIIPRKFLEEIRGLLAAHRWQEARDLSEHRPSPIAAVCSAALDYAQRVENPDPALLKEIIEGEGSRQAALIQNQTQYLLDIAVISPMVGLLGTVMGMLKAFNTVALDIAKAKPMLLAAGVSQALITTAAGLIVGIPAMVAYAYFRGRSSKLLSNLETASADLLTLIVQKKS